MMGGPSSERDISLKSGRAVFEALKGAGCDAVALEISSADEQELVKLLKSSGIQVAFIALHGRFGEDGAVQGILEKAGVPYTGSGVEASRIAINKISTQQLLKERGIPVPRFIILKKGQKIDAKEIFSALGGPPVVVKPEAEGSSIGISFVQEAEDLPKAVDEALKYSPSALVEQRIRGRELTVGVLGNRALPIVEIRTKEKFFDYTAKYQKGLTEYLVPAPLPENTAAGLQGIALKAYRAVGCRHLARIDIMLDENEQPFVLEINTIPGFTETSLLPKAAKQEGVDFAQLCVQLVKMAYEK